MCEDIEPEKNDEGMPQAGARGHDFYQQYTNQELPLPKLDFAAVPGKTGAMENWGLLLFDEPRMLAHPV